MPQINLMELAEQSFGTSLEQLDDRRIYKLLVKLVQERSAACPLNNGKKKLYYISAEFLIGKLLINNMIDLGIYDEVPGEYGKWNHRMLDGGYLQTYSAAAKVIEESDLDYTIIRPAWLSDDDEVDYELTQKDEPFQGTEVSRKSVGALVAELVKNPADSIGASLGVNKPGTDGDKPSWY